MMEGAPPDVLIAVGEYPPTAFLSHSILLAQQSSYFKSIFTVDPVSRVIHLPSVNLQAFSHIFPYLYTGILTLNMFNVYEILRTASYLHMQSVIELCESFLQSSTPEGSQMKNEGNVIVPPTLTGHSTTESIKTFQNFTAISDAEHESSKLEDSHEQKNDSNENITNVQNLDESKFTTNLAFNGIRPFTRNTTSPIEKSDVAYCDGPIQFQKIPNIHCQKGQEEKLNLEPVLKKKKAKFMCHCCGKCFLVKNCFLKHLEQHNTVSREPAEQPREWHQKNETKVVKSIGFAKSDFQYYTCKLCNSKFPSYYFVHKHKKRFHKEM